MIFLGADGAEHAVGSDLVAVRKPGIGEQMCV